MNFCPKCKFKVDPMWNACPQCGSNLKRQENIYHPIWEEIRLPKFHICMSIILLFILIILFQFGLIFLIALPIILIPIYLFFFNKNNFLIRFTEEELIIKPKLISFKRNFRYNKISKITISFVKRAETYNVGKGRGHTSILFFDFQIENPFRKKKYSFKRKWFVSKRYPPDKRKKMCLEKRETFERSLKELEKFLPNLLKIEDLAPESSKPKLVWQDKFFFPIMIIFLSIIFLPSILAGGEFVIIFSIIIIISMCGMIIIMLFSRNKNKIKITQETNDYLVLKENNLLIRTELSIFVGLVITLFAMLRSLDPGEEFYPNIFYMAIIFGIITAFSIFFIIPNTQIELDDNEKFIKKNRYISLFKFQRFFTPEEIHYNEILRVYYDEDSMLKLDLHNREEFGIFSAINNQNKQICDKIKNYIEKWISN